MNKSSALKSNLAGRKEYRFPRGMRFSELYERKEFYEKEFSADSFENWFRDYPQDVVKPASWKKPVFAIDFGTDSGIIKSEFSSFYRKLMYISKYDDFTELKKRCALYLPEDIYYERNIFSDYEKCRTCKQRWNCTNCDNFLGQELVFDIDPENIECNCKRIGIYSFCEKCLEKAKSETIELYKKLKKDFGFNSLKIVYSGRGYHIHVLDRNAFTLTPKERRKITAKLLKSGFHIDEWVSNGHISLARMPGTLHALVSRIVAEIKIEEIRGFNPEKNSSVIPKFIKKNKKNEIPAQS